jgi:hypothetical protein
LYSQLFYSSRHHFLLRNTYSVEDAYRQTPRRMMNSDRGHSLSDSPALIPYIMLQRYVQEGHQLMYQPCLLKLRDNESHVTTDRLIQCSLRPHEVASQTSAFVNKKRQSRISSESIILVDTYQSTA